MKWTFIDDTYTGLCDVLNELDIVNLVEVDSCTNDDVIAALAHAMLEAQLDMGEVRNLLGDFFEDICPVEGYTGDDIALLVVESDLRAFMTDIRQILATLNGRHFTEFTIKLLPTSYQITLEVI